MGRETNVFKEPALSARSDRIQPPASLRVLEDEIGREGGVHPLS